MAEMMKAAVYYALDDIRIEDRPIPKIGRDEMLFVFKLRTGRILELRYSEQTREQIARLCSELNRDPIERTSDVPRYLAAHPFYRELAVRFHGARASENGTEPG